MDVVNSIKDVKLLINLHEHETVNTYRTIKYDKYFGDENIDLSSNTFTIRYEDTQKNATPQIPFDGIPFIIRGKKTMECHQGKDRNVAKKMKAKQMREQQTDHDFTKHRHLVQNTKKRDCPAMIKVRHIIKLTDYKLEKNTTYGREQMSAMIHSAVDQGRHVNIKHVYLVSIPCSTDHMNHHSGEVAQLIQPLDARLRAFIKDMVKERNTLQVSEMKLLLDIYVKETLFKDQPLPPLVNTRYWPSQKTIRNHILLGLMEIRNSTVDQKVVEDKISEWKEQFPQDKFYLRLKEDRSEPESSVNSLDISDKDEFDSETASIFYGNKEKFLYVHQTEWQRRLLNMYGSEIALLDGTYRTTKYALPLYFLCVPTNVNYITVATFVIETEDKKSIMEALHMIKEWNPEWKPTFFMSDYCEEEISSLESVFPETLVYLCDFHREQSWERWLGTTHNGLLDQKENVLMLLRAIAKSESEEEFQVSVSTLQESEAWISNSRFRNWFTRYWLDKADRWLQCRRKERFNVSINTNNGVERQHKALKYEYLKCRKSSSLSHLLSVIVESFLKDSYRSYLQLNVESSENARSYAEDIPAFLHNRPKNIVSACYKRWVESATFLPDSIEEVEEGIFFVKSQTTDKLVYEINFNPNQIGLPSCSCPDWGKSHLPCKHFFAIFRIFDSWGWNSLPQSYITNPMLNLDLHEPFQQNMETVNEDADINEEVLPVFNSSMENIDQDTNKSQNKIEKEKVISLCREISDAIHHCSDINTITQIAQSLKETLTTLKSAIPHTEHFILDNSKMTYIGTRKSQRKAKIKRNSIGKLLRLPKRRQKAPGSSRHGVAAAMKRAHFTRKGAHDLLLARHEPSHSTSNGIEEVLEEIIAATDDERTVREDHTDSQSSEKEEDGKFEVNVEHKSEETNKFQVAADLGTSISCSEDAKLVTQHEKGIKRKGCLRDRAKSSKRNGNIAKKVALSDPIEQVHRFETSINAENMAVDVIGYRINQQSFRDLDSMLPDEIMNAYISLKCREVTDRRVQFIACEVMTSIFTQGVNPNDAFPVHSFLSGIEIEEYDIMIGALNEGGMHWTLMVIFPFRHELMYLNPLGETRQMKDRFLQRWLLFLGERYNRGFGDMPLESWSMISARHRKQMDSNSCGVFVLKFAELILTGKEDNLIFDSSKKGLRTLRLELGQYLVENSDNMQEIAVTQEISEIVDEELLDPNNQERENISENNEGGKDDEIDIDQEDEDVDDSLKESCQKMFFRFKDYLLEITNCEEKHCKQVTHQRHHAFLRSPNKHYTETKGLRGFGLDLLNQATQNGLALVIFEEMVMVSHDPRKPYSTRFQTIRGATNQKLEHVFKVYGLLLSHYQFNVLMKELIIMIAMEENGKNYDDIEKKCLETEINITEQFRQLRLSRRK